MLSYCRFHSYAVRTLVTFVTVALSSATTFSQPAAATQVTKDPSAVAIAQKALLAMGGASLATYQDSYATGSVTIYADTGSQSFPAVLHSKGLHGFRYEIQKPKGTDSYTTDGTIACIARANGTLEAGGILALAAQRIDYLPAFSLLSEYANSSLSIQYVGTANVNGQLADVISLSFNVTVPGYGPGQIGKRNVFVDQVTGLVTKIQGYYVDDTTPNNTLLSVKPTPKSIVQYRIQTDRYTAGACRIRFRFPINGLADITQFLTT